jgi:translation initiation factor 2 beta subunit (eIF-2beta)/eIF-5
MEKYSQPEHVTQFLFAEMGTTGSVDGAGRLVIKGRFQQKQIENVLRRYIGTFLPFTCLSFLFRPAFNFVASILASHRRD